jgi:hypothetical protein
LRAELRLQFNDLSKPPLKLAQFSSYDIKYNYKGRDMLGLLPPIPSPRNFDEPKKPSRHVKFLDFDPFDTFKDQWFLRSCLRLGSLGSFGWALYLIVNAIGTNIAYDIDRRRNKLTGDPARHS